MAIVIGTVKVAGFKESQKRPITSPERGYGRHERTDR